MSYLFCLVILFAMELAEAIKTEAFRLGFDAVGITTAEPLEPAHTQAFSRWLQEGCAEGLPYMKRHLGKRFSPSCLLEGACSVICVALHYKPPAFSQSSSIAQIAHFALYDDYHPIIKERLHRLAAFIQTRLTRNFPWRYKICVDSAPLAERALAVRAGLGFLGKNHMLIHPVLGSQILLGELLTTLPLPPDVPLSLDGCGRCSRCLEACPTGALHPNGLFQTSRCISFLTQYAADFAGFEQKLGNRLFGCDSCLLACPYEQKAPPSRQTVLRFHPERTALPLQEILQWEQKQFDCLFKNSCIEKIGLNKLRQNAAACLNHQNKPQ